MTPLAIDRPVGPLRDDLEHRLHVVRRTVDHPQNVGRGGLPLQRLLCLIELGDAVPEDHLVRRIDTALDLSWLRGELAPHYSSMGRPSVDPELMIRMLVVGYVFAIRSERLTSRKKPRSGAR